MSHKIAKQLRKYLFNRQISIQSEPYTTLSNGQIIASEGRRKYQLAKKATSRRG